MGAESSVGLCYARSAQIVFLVVAYTGRMLSAERLPLFLLVGALLLLPAIGLAAVLAFVAHRRR